MSDDAQSTSLANSTSYNIIFGGLLPDHLGSLIKAKYLYQYVFYADFNF